VLILGSFLVLFCGIPCLESRYDIEVHGSRVQNCVMEQAMLKIPPGEQRDSIYLAHFQRSLSEVFQKRDDYRNLFSEEEKKIADPFLNLDAPKALSRAARCEPEMT
jgi:hypothetical protein